MERGGCTDGQTVSWSLQRQHQVGPARQTLASTVGRGGHDETQVTALTAFRAQQDTLLVLLLLLTRTGRIGNDRYKTTSRVLCTQQQPLHVYVMPRLTRRLVTLHFVVSDSPAQQFGVSGRPNR